MPADGYDGANSGGKPGGPRIDVYMGNHVHGDRSICEMFVKGALFYETHDQRSVFYQGVCGGVPDKLAQPSDDGPNPELYQFGTAMYHPRVEKLWALPRVE